MPNELLRTLLDDNLCLPAEYAGGLANHLPMALHALDRLGADAQRLRRFYDAYAPRLGPMPPAEVAPPLTDWLSQRGNPAALRALQSTFDEALRHDDPAVVLSRTVPHLMSGVGAAAFHGVLRTAHAVEVGHVGELAHGLAYWAAQWFELPPPDVLAPMPFDAWKCELVRQATGWMVEAPLIALRMEQAGRSTPYHAVAGRLATGPDTVAKLCGLAATVYAESGNFTALHLVTGCRAVRVMLPFAGEAVPALAGVVRAFTAAYLATGVAGAEPLAPQSSVPWSELLAAAMQSNDEHVVKGVDACRQLASVYGDRPYRQAAIRMVS